MSDSGKSTEVVELTIRLRRFEPNIWRKIRVPVSIDLQQLHSIIQVLFDWENKDIHSFFIDYQQYLPDNQLVNDPFESGVKREVDTNIASLIYMKVDKFVYTYCFNSAYEYVPGADYTNARDHADTYNWEHLIMIESVHTISNLEQKVCLLDGENAVPSEDCGGPPGYKHQMEVLSDPLHEEYKKILAVYGNDYDQTFFDKDIVNDKLSRIDF